VPAGGRVTLFKIEAPTLRDEEGNAVVCNTEFRYFSITQEDDIYLQRYLDADPLGTEIRTSSLPGLDKTVEIAETFKHEQEYRVDARNAGAADITVRFRAFFLHYPQEQLPGDVRAIIYADATDIAAYAEQTICEIHVPQGYDASLTHMTTSRNTNIVIYARLNGELITPVDGFNAGASPTLAEFTIPNYNLSPREDLIITAVNTSGATQPFAWRFIAHTFKRE